MSQALNITKRNRIPACMVFLAMLGVPLCTSWVHAEDGDLSAVRKAVEGVYEIAEWYTPSGDLVKPPTVDGRLIFLNGTNSIYQFNRMKKERQTISASYGHYTLTPTEFAYTYDNTNNFVITGENITVSHENGFKGMRKFKVSRDGTTVRFRSESGEQEWIFTPEAFTYVDTSNTQWRGKRIYKRIGDK